MNEKSQFASLRFGDFHLNLQSGELHNGGIRVRLPRQSFKILAILLERPGQVVAREELRKNLWPADTFVDFEHSVNSAVKRLREALNDTADNPRFIETLPRLGYRYIGPAVVRPEPAVPSPEAAAPAIATEAAEPVVLFPAIRTRNHRATVLRLAFGFSVLVAGLFAFNVAGIRERVVHLVHPSPPPSAPTVALAAVKPRTCVAILGFQNLSGRPDQAWLSTALAEMLSTELGAGGQLRIVPSEEVAQTRINLSVPYTDALSKPTLSRLRQNLGADLVVLGSYSTLGKQSGRQIRFDLRVQDAAAGETIAAFSEAGREADLYQLVSRAGVHLRQRLDLQELLPAQAMNVRATLPVDPEAARLYSEGLQKLRIFDFVGARDLLLKSITLEPKFPLAHSALAQVFIALGYEQKASTEAAKASQLSSDLSREDRLIIQGQYGLAKHEWKKAADAYRTLFDLFPDNLGYGLQLAMAQTLGSESRDALATVVALRKLPAPSGDDPRIDIAESIAWDRLGQYQQQEQVLETAVAKARSQGALLVLARARSRQCWVFGNVGKPQKAIDTCREAEKIYATAGDRRGQEDALRVWGDAVADSDPAAGISLYRQALDMANRIGNVTGQASALNEMAIQYGVLGDHAKAKSLYQKSLAIYRQLGDKVGTAALTGNVAKELRFQGRLVESMKMYQDNVASAHKLGATSIEAEACYNIALLIQFRGDLAAAKEWLNKSLDLYRQADYQVGSTYPLQSLGELAMEEGDLDGARKLLQRSLDIRQEQQEKIGAAESSLELALLSINEGRSLAEAEASARNAAQLLHDAKAKDEEARAYAITALVLLAEGKPVEALKISDQATAISSTSQDPNYRLFVTVAAARIRGLTGRPGSALVLQAIRTLRKAADEARRLGYLGIHLDARLSLGEVEMKSGQRAEGRSLLAQLEKEAAAKGFLLIARKAQTASANQKDGTKNHG